MSKANEVYEGIAHSEANIKNKVITALRDNFAIIILATNIILSISLTLFDARVENPFNVYFFIQLATDLATTMFCYCTFIPYGHKMEKLAMQGYKENCQNWSILSGNVRNSLSAEFDEFCKNRTDEEREERRKAIIQNHTMISWQDFESSWRGKSKKDVREAMKKGLISRKEAHYINRANNVIKVNPINPLLILCGVKISTLNDVGRDGISPSTVSILIRPISMFILNVIVNMLHGSWRGISTGEEVYRMFLSILAIIMASVMGYSAGVNSARKEHDKIKGRIFFLEKFLKETAV